MIRLLVGLVVRALVELALVLFVFAALFLVVAYRAARLFATPAPDKLDKLAGAIARGLGLVAGRSSSRPEEADEPELDDLTEEEAEASVDFWRSVTV